MTKALQILKYLTTFCGQSLHNQCVEAIAELEEAMKPKTCEGCDLEYVVGDANCMNCKRNTPDLYINTKEQE